MSQGSHDMKPGAAKEEGIYLYCLARDGVPQDMALQGLEEHHSVRQRTFKNITAFMSPISLHEFCGPEATSHMKDLSWVGPRACRHEAVVERAMDYSPVLPTRFGTIFSCLENLEAFISEHYDTISQFLDSVTDQAEWAVKGLMDRGKAREEFVALSLAEEEKNLAQLSPGLRYFQERKIRTAAEKKLDAWLKEVSRVALKRLEPQASASQERPIVQTSAKGADGTVILNWAFLVPKDNMGNFLAMIDRTNRDHEQRGLVFKLSGPWPPYSFCPSLEAG